jgi:hypothetical protein
VSAVNHLKTSDRPLKAPGNGGEVLLSGGSLSYGASNGVEYIDDVTGARDGGKSCAGEGEGEGCHARWKYTRGNEP